MLKMLFNLCVHVLIVFFIMSKIFKAKSCWKISFTITFFGFFFLFTWLFMLIEFSSLYCVIRCYPFFFLLLFILFLFSMPVLVSFWLQKNTDPTFDWWTCIFQLFYFKISSNFLYYKKLQKNKVKYFLMLNELWKFIMFSYFLLILLILLMLFFVFFSFYVNNLALLKLWLCLKIYKMKIFFFFFFMMNCFLLYYSLFLNSNMNCYYFSSINFFVIPGSVDKLENSTNYLKNMKILEMRSDMYFDSVYLFDDSLGVPSKLSAKSMNMTFDDSETYLSMLVPHGWVDFKTYVWDSQQVDNCLYDFNSKFNEYLMSIFTAKGMDSFIQYSLRLECSSKYESDLK